MMGLLHGVSMKKLQRNQCEGCSLDDWPDSQTLFPHQTSCLFAPHPTLDKQLVCTTAPLILGRKGENGNDPKWMLHQGSHSQGPISPSKMTSSFRGFDHSNGTPTDWPAFLFLRQQSHQIHNRILKCTLKFGISSILVVQVKRMALQQTLDSVSALGGGSLPDFHTFFVLDKWKMQREVKNPQPIIEAAASGRWDADWLWHFLLPALPIGSKANNGQQSSGVTRDQKKHEPRPANSTFGPFLFVYSLEMFTWLRARTHSCTAANCHCNVVLHLAEGTKEAGKAQTLLLKSTCVSLDSGLALCASVDVSRQETQPPSGCDPYSWQVSLNICQPNPLDRLCFCTRFILFCFERLLALYLGELKLCWIHQGQCHQLRTFWTQTASQPQIFYRQ